MSYISTDTFIDIANDYDCDSKQIRQYILDNVDPNYTVTTYQIDQRIANYRRKGKLPLQSGNKVSNGEFLKGTSTLYGPTGEVKQQWVKTDVDKTALLEAFQTAISSLTSEITPLAEVPSPTLETKEDLATLYISNDVHVGALMWAPESGEDYDTEIASTRLKEAYDHLFATSPASKVGIVADLGDLLEVDNFTNTTPMSGNPLDSDSRFPKILRTAYKGLIYAIQLALTKHETVYFYNIAGNHDKTIGHAVREIISAFFENNPRVIVNNDPISVKYHQHGNTLLGFAHGDGLKMKDAGETMAYDNQAIFSQTVHRFFHFG